MKIQFLGTAATEGIPALFCNCRICQYARANQDKELRTRSSVLIDDKIKIDFPPDTLYHSIKYGIKFRELSAIFITHGHYDHFAFEELRYSGSNFVKRDRHEKLKIFMPEDCLSKFKDEDCCNLELLPIKAYQVIEIDNYKITAVPAVHGDGQYISLNYIVESDEDSIFYACDTGYYEESFWDNFPKTGNISKLIMDCSIGCKKFYCKNHMNIYDNLKFFDKLKSKNLLADDCRSCITHFSHNGGQTHEEMTEFLKDKNIIVAYDGMVLS